MNDAWEGDEAMGRIRCMGQTIEHLRQMADSMERSRKELMKLYDISEEEVGEAVEGDHFTLRLVKEKEEENDE